MLNVARYGTRDLERAKAFYDEIAALVGARRVADRPEVAGYMGASGGMFLIGIPLEGEASVGNGTQVGFTVASPEIVDTVHAKALALGGTTEGDPGYRGPEEYGFYAAYFRDLDGNKIIVFNQKAA